MKTDPLSVRFAPEERAALEKAAAADARSMSALARKLVVDWLRQNGWMDARAARSAVKAPDFEPCQLLDLAEDVDSHAGRMVRAACAELERGRASGKRQRPFPSSDPDKADNP